MRGRRPWPFLLLAVAVLLGVAVAGSLLSSPSHRQFYSRLFLRTSEKSPAEPLASRPPPLPASVPRAPRPPEQTTSRPKQRPATIQPGRLAEGPKFEVSPKAVVGRSSTGERVVVRVADTLPAKRPSVGVPPGWHVKEFVGRAQAEVVREASRPLLRLVSQGTSFALYRDVVLDLKQFPILIWRWKVMKLPAGGDVRERTRDDQAIQVYLVFPRWPDPRINSDVVGYVWDSRAPRGTRLSSTRSPNVKVIVLQSGTRQLGRWVQEERNVYRDYVELFHKEPSRIGLVALMADTNDTRGQAEAFIGDLVFLRPRSRSAGHP